MIVSVLVQRSSASGSSFQEHTVSNMRVTKLQPWGEHPLHSFTAFAVFSLRLIPNWNRSCSSLSSPMGFSWWWPTWPGIKLQFLGLLLIGHCHFWLILTFGILPWKLLYPECLLERNFALGSTPLPHGISWMIQKALKYNAPLKLPEPPAVSRWGKSWMQSWACTCMDSCLVLGCLWSFPSQRTQFQLMLHFIY